MKNLFKPSMKRICSSYCSVLLGFSAAVAATVAHAQAADKTQSYGVVFNSNSNDKSDTQSPLVRLGHIKGRLEMLQGLADEHEDELQSLNAAHKKSHKDKQDSCVAIGINNNGLNTTTNGAVSNSDTDAAIYKVSNKAEELKAVIEQQQSQIDLLEKENNKSHKSQGETLVFGGMSFSGETSVSQYTDMQIDSLEQTADHLESILDDQRASISKLQGRKLQTRETSTTLTPAGRRTSFVTPIQ